MREWLKRMKDSRVVVALLSVVIACIMWIYVVNVSDPDISHTVRGVPIVMVGRSTLESRQLVVTAQSSGEINLHLSGKRNALANLTNWNITVSADLTGIEAPGSYDLACVVTLPSSVTGGAATVDERESYRVSVTVEALESKRVAVSGVLTGSLAEGYEGGEFSLDPAWVELTGPASQLEAVAGARVCLDEEALRESFAGELPLELTDRLGQPLEWGLVECAVSSVRVEYPVLLVRRLPVTVSFLEGGGVGVEQVRYELTPPSVLVAGAREDVMGLAQLEVGSVDLSQVAMTDTLTLPLTLPEGVVCREEVEEITLTLTLEGVTSRTLSTGQIEVTNLPQGLSYEVLTDAVRVTVRGEAAAVAAVTAEQLWLSVDLTELPHVAGVYELPARARLDAAGQVGVVDEGYTVQLRVYH